MSASNTTPAPRASGTWLQRWEPENEQFWNSGGSALAWRTLTITTLNLTMAFMAWFLVSALVVRLPQIGFKFTPTELFWLAAMPGLAGGTLRLVHMFLTPMFGTRHVVSLSTLSLLVPLVGWFYAVQNPATPYWVLLVLAFLAGLGGGNFSSFMPSTSLFFPKRLQGTALAIQAGVGNFGVSIVQFVTPWVIGFSLLGGAAFMGESQTMTKAGVQSQVWLQNAPAVMIPFVVVFGISAWLMLKSVPIKANFAQQFDIFRSRHTWSMTSLYIMTFGAFSGLSATFPLLIRQIYGGFEGAPDPLAWAFYGPLVGSASRVIAGPLSDKLGGARVTHWAALGMLGATLWVTTLTSPTGLDSFPLFVAGMLTLFFFAGIGNASTFKQMPMLFEPRQAGGVIGFTGAIAAYGPFIFGMLFAWSFATFKSATPIFYGLAAFFAFNAALNWWMYARRGAANPC
ncbi:MFS transporter [Calidifontimicrobium sp. SYSU G02091]|uniref:MFS transporter n=1 Tax=Calidifontimicrobium sp. SYSU G02091 TaxID=2926421 RepID=UPI001F52F26F|nr:MFS transporter [Calidifontimicrobium sp. SYSU G02091]MCI1191424.1 MFS transporter [Calidifontimicrobium sp. SYSU G02091]